MRHSVLYTQDVGSSNPSSPTSLEIAIDVMNNHPSSYTFNNE